MTQDCVKTAAASAGILASAFCAYHVYNEVKKSKLPTTWRKVGTLKDINFYPIKSCGSVQKDKAECTFLGLKDGWLRDRILMVADERNHFITARKHPKLLLIHPTMKNSILTLTSKGMEPLQVNLEKVMASQTIKYVSTWDRKYPVYECGQEASEWLSRFLVGSTATYKLVLYAPRQSRKNFFNKLQMFANKSNGAFADETPFNLVNQASIDDLNSRLEGIEVSHKNFRPNFLLSGAEPYDEDNWKFVKIGENIFEIVKACTRCIMTVNNPETGLRNPNVEPLTTLRRYRLLTDPEMRRKAGNTPKMGLQMVLRSDNGGIVSVNDSIYVA